LLDLLWRNRRDELQMSIAMVIANHPDLAERVRPFGVPFIHIPATRDTRAEAEQRQPPTTSPKYSMRGRSSNRTSYVSITRTLSTT